VTRFTYRQFHNQPAGSPLDRWLGRLWDAVRAATDGRLVVEVCPHNAGVPGGDPQALEMLRTGDLEFYVLMGGLLGTVTPVAEITGLPFVFADCGQVFAALDGALGDHIRDALLAHGIYAVPRACFDNGFRHITTRTRPICTLDDLAGLRIRTPAGRMFVEFFEFLGARPVAINLNRLHDAVRDGTVEAQENPLAMVEVNRLYEVQTHLSLTAHMWSGFNLLANVARWRALPADVRATVERLAPEYVAGQRAENAAFNAALPARLAARGMIVNEADRASLSAGLGPFYARWRREVGPGAWALLEAVVGPIR
jgi:tripartite ATP-independent transporter DctP family solute receptor